MAAAKIDMSLDDIAKSSTKKGRGGRRKSRGRGGRGRGRSRSKGRGGNRNRGRGGYGAQRKGRGGYRKTPYSRPATGQRFSASGSKITVANLDFEVTAEDVKEIFQQIGNVKKAVLHYNQNGRSLGTAEVTFASQGLAVKAIKEYDQAEVDGRPMYLKLVASVVQGKTVTPRVQRRQSQGGGRRGQRGRGGGRGRGRGRGRSRGRGRRGRGRGRSGGRGGRGGRRQQQQKTPSLAELDAEMDAYHNTDTPAAPTAGQPKTAFTGQPPAINGTNGKKDSE